MLRWQLQVQQIAFPEHKGPAIWAYELLRAGASQIQDPAAFGLAIDPMYREHSLSQLKKQIDHEFYILSEAHYQRYFPAVPVKPAARLEEVSE